MKKTKASIIIMILTIVAFMNIISIKSYAAEKANAVINITSNTQKIESKQSTIEVTISLRTLENLNLTNGKLVLGYEATLDYDSNIIESATVEGLNGWTVVYEASTKKIVGDTVDAKANTDTAKIVLKLKNNIPNGTSGKISVKNLLLTDGTNDFSFSKNITIEKKNSENTENKTNTPTNTTNTNTSTNKSNTQTSNNSATSGNNTNKSNSSLTANTAITKLPAAGLNNVIILAIVIVLIAAIIFKFKSRKIKY